MFKIERREALKLIFAGGLGFAISACSGESIIFQREQNKPSEKLHRIPQTGDVMMDGEKTYRKILDKKYLIPDLQKYLKYTKQENAEILSGTPEVLDALSKCETAAVPQEETIIVQGDIKKNKPLGGELICVGGGFMTEDGIPSNGLIRPANLFIPFKKRLEKNGFTHMDEFFFPWGKGNLDMYSALDTGKDPKESIDDMIRYIEFLAKEFPLVEQNWIVHSLAGVILMGALIKRPDLLGLINNIAFLSSPVRGLDDTHKSLLDLVKSQNDTVKLYLGNEKVSSYLAEIWKDKDGYQKQVDKVGKTLIDSGKGIIDAFATNDPILSEDMVRIDGATSITILNESFNIRDPFTYLDPHGSTLRNEMVIEKIAQKIGENRTDLH